jgi:diacylglycerol kinase family enzyme
MPLRTADAALALREGLTRAIDAGRVTFKSDRRQLTDGGRELKSGGRELTNDGGELVSGSGALTGGGAEEETRFFLNVASFGMGGEVIRRVKERAGLPAGASRVLGGRLSFALAAIQSTLAFEKPAVRVALDGHAESQLTVTNFCVANARYFGGGMKIAPTALLDDGLFDVVAVGDLSALKVLANSYRVYLGTHLGMRQVQHARARLVTARPTGSEEVKLEIDGELAGRLPATFEILPGALRVRCPK